MRTYTQETDSTLLAWPSGSWNLTQDETFGDHSDWSRIPILDDLIEPALKAVTQTENHDMVQLAISILCHIKETTAVLFTHKILDLGYLPRVRGFSVDDGSLLLEWVFGGFRVGFSVERDLSESSWHLVSDSNLGDIAASGFISQERISSTIVWLLTFVVLHS